MSVDLKKSVNQNVARNANVAADRFEAARAPHVVVERRVETVAKPEVREGKSDGKKFWLPECDDRLIDELKRAAQVIGLDSNRSQIVRAGVHLLKTLSQERFKALIAAECEQDEARGLRR